jgi:hypothetical protein
MTNRLLNAGTVYHLSNDEQKLIIGMSETICNQNREFFIDNYKRDKSIPLLEMNKNGFGAELAFCRLCETTFDSSTIERESHFDKIDATLPDGTLIDVKTTVYKNGKLIVRHGKEKKVVDIYVLMTGTFPTFTFCGWASYEEIIKIENIDNLGWGDAYCLPQNRLNKELKIVEREK